jgi:hypothetical protein
MKRLQEAIENKQREHDEISDDKKEDKEKAASQLQALEEALSGWEQTMADYNQTNTLSKNGNLTIIARDWFDKWAVPTDVFSEKSPKISSGVHWSNLAPEGLTNRAEALDVEYAEDLRSGDKDDLKNTNRIQFSGGGATTEFFMGHEGADFLLTLDPPDVAQNDDMVEQTHGFEGELQVMGIGLGGETSKSVAITSVAGAHVSTEKGKETSISFVLGDAQKDDEFAVDVYIDPTYGTCKNHSL